MPPARPRLSVYLSIAALLLLPPIVGAQKKKNCPIRKRSQNSRKP